MTPKSKNGSLYQALSTSTALTVTRRAAVFIPASLALFTSTAMSQDARDFIHDNGSTTISTDQVFEDDFIVGLNNKGVSLDINNGAKVLVNNRVVIAGVDGSQSTVTVSGPGSELNVRRTNSVLGNLLTIGGGCNGYSLMCVTGGDGTLIIENGGKVDAREVHLAEGMESRGTLLVTGVGSVLTTDTFTSAQSGDEADSITVENGGSILTNYAGIGLRNAPGGTSAINVRGQGSNWTNTGTFDLSGSMAVSDGGTFATSTASLDTHAELIVSGAASTINVSDNIEIEDDGHVVVAQGGSLNVANSIDIGNSGYLVIGGQIDTDSLAGEPKIINTQAAGKINPEALVDFGKSGTGRVVFNHSDTAYEFSNKIVGDGSIVSLAGETILTGDLTGFASFDSYAGGVIVDGNSRLVIKGDLGTAIADDDTVSPDRTNFSVRNGTLVIGGQTGQIVTNFLGSEIYTSRVDVWGDTLNSANDGTSVTGKYGRLAGFGTVGTTRVDKGASISPGDIGNPLGTIKVRGDLDFIDGSVYEVDVAANGDSDRIEVETLKQYAGVDANSDPITVDGLGRTTIGNDTAVHVTALDAATSYQSGQTYTILTSQGGITGSFAEAISKSAFLDVALDQREKEIDLRISVKDTGAPPPTNPNPEPPTNPAPEPPTNPNPEPPTNLNPEPPTNPAPEPPTNPGAGLFDSVADTSNQVAVARSLNTLQQSGESLALYNRLLLLSADEARGAFDQLSGEAHAAVKSGLVSSNHFIRDAANDRLRAASGDVAAKPVPVSNYWDNGRWMKEDPMAAILPKPLDPAWSAWGQAFGSWSSLDADSGRAKTDVATGGFVTGIDTLVDQEVRLGAFASYSRSNFEVDDRTSSGDSDNYSFGIYGSKEWGPLAVRTGAAYTVHRISTDRFVNFPGLSQQLKADYDAASFQVYGEVGYEVQTTVAAFEPFLNVAHVNLRTDAFSENGGSAALSVQKDTTNTTFTTLGLRTSSDFSLGGVLTKASGTVGWRHAFGDTDPSSRMSFAGSDSFVVDGAAVSQNALVVQVGLDFALSADATFGVSYNGEYGGDGVNNGVDAKLSVQF
ncbi:autotransporter domain-containing protein [Agrobacterium rubi]|uniref:Autotransporter domain-containing protein n=1 Tax=Agrobacterium rubi TaxID=28099 RepID=A0AAE7RD65_9HYPH|nr:autotransporter domain-containing protein [Agrobacterium rubi]QTG01864.1 autotransporter domain-containing protein [Agrobacterium rubi]